MSEIILAAIKSVCLSGAIAYFVSLVASIKYGQGIPAVKLWLFGTLVVSFIAIHFNWFGVI